MSTSATWEHEAENWIAWARTPGHDIFPYYWPSFLAEIVPENTSLTLEIGCGEGRVARALADARDRVIAIDGSPTLVRAARDGDGRAGYANASATTLPFTDSTFDVVVAYNSLQTMTHFGDMQAAVHEAGRVLRASGHLCLCVAHPITDLDRSGHQRETPASYFEHQRVDDHVTKNGLQMTFRGWTYTLEDYARALDEAGLAIERVREPQPTGDDVPSRRDLERWRQEPLFLFIPAVKRGQVA